MNKSNKAHIMSLIETKQWFAIYKDGEPFCFVSKTNSIEKLTKIFELQKIKLMTKGEQKCY